MKHVLAPLCASLLLAACAPQPGSTPGPQSVQDRDAQITQRLAGSRITVNNMILDIKPDGSLGGTLAGGDPIVGTWSIQNGQWCRSFVQPNVALACQDLVIDADTMTVTTPNGPQTWRFL